MSASMRRISENQIKPLILSYQHICFTSASLRWDLICAAARHFCSSLLPWDPPAFISPSPLLGSLPPTGDPAFWKGPFPQLCFPLYCAGRAWSTRLWRFPEARPGLGRGIKSELWLINVSKVSRPIGFWGPSNCSSGYLLWILKYCNWRENIYGFFLLLSGGCICVVSIWMHLLAPKNVRTFYWDLYRAFRPSLVQIRASYQ